MGGFQNKNCQIEDLSHLIKNNDSSKKVFNFYYDLYCQKLIVYEGTPANEIMATIRDLLQIPSEAKLEFSDEEGIPIVISSALPNDIKIHIKIKKTFTEKFIESQNNNNNKINTIPKSIEWFWLESDSPNTHKRKNNNKTIYQPDNKRTSECRGNLIIDSGEYYYTLLFEPLRCCVFASVCNAEQQKQEQFNSLKDKELYRIENEINWIDFWRLWPDYKNPNANWPGPVIEAGFYVNMNYKLVVVYDNKLKKEVKRYNFNANWKKISPVVSFKHVVSITISSYAIEGKPDFIVV